MTHKLSRQHPMAFAVVFLLLAACVPKVPLDRPIAAGQGTPDIHITVALVLTPQFKTAKMADDSTDLGPALEHYSRMTLGSMVDKVVVVSTAQDAPRDAAAIVIPTLKRIEQTSTVAAWQERRLSLALEWLVHDRSGKRLLLDTVLGESSGEQGGAFTINANYEDQTGRLMEVTFAKSKRALEPVLRAAAR